MRGIAVLEFVRYSMDVGRLTGITMSVLFGDPVSVLTLGDQFVKYRSQNIAIYPHSASVLYFMNHK